MQIKGINELFILGTDKDIAQNQKWLPVLPTPVNNPNI